MSVLLRRLTPEDEQAFSEACAHVDDSAHTFALGRAAGQDYADYLQYLKNQEAGVNLPKGFVPATYLCGFVDGKIVGRVSFRHELNEYLSTVGGHIGYVTLPPYRRRGYATEMLQKTLLVARALGLNKVLLTCDNDNIGSVKTIEACGGVFEGHCFDSKSIKKRRYWITLSRAI